jgi:hypothetical protein
MKRQIIENLLRHFQSRVKKEDVQQHLQYLLIKIWQ